MDDDDQVSTPAAPDEPPPSSEAQDTPFTAPGLPSAPAGDTVSAGGTTDWAAIGRAEAVPSDAPAGGAPGSYEEQAAAVAQAAAGPTMRGPMSLISMGVVLFLFAIAGWWAQDAIGTLSNEGEAAMGRTVTFQSDGGRYRLLSSGPLRPDPNSTWCDITESDGDTHREVGGQGLQTARLGVDRLLTFNPPAGETTVTCSFRDTGPGSGRFQVLDTGSPLAQLPLVLFGAGVLSFLIGIAWGYSAYSRLTRSGAN